MILMQQVPPATISFDIYVDEQLCNVCEIFFNCSGKYF